MCNSKANKNEFISELGEFLAEFNSKNPQLSPTQQYERNKYARINRLRDATVVEVVKETEVTKDIWDNF